MIWVATAQVTVCIACDDEPTSDECIDAILEEVHDNGSSAFSLDWNAGGRATCLEDVPRGWRDALPRTLNENCANPDATVSELLEEEQARRLEEEEEVTP